MPPIWSVDPWIDDGAFDDGRADVLDVLLLDNRDSFTWNLAQAFEELGASVRVEEALERGGVDDVLAERPRLVCVGPGPRGPADLPRLVELVGGLCGRAPLLGVCLGMQALVRAFGGVVERAAFPVHGKRCPVEHDGTGLFSGLPSPLWVMRYHSLVAREVPARFRVNARDPLGQPMAIVDDDARAFGVQFHPESIGTAGGMEMLRRALALAGLDVPPPAPRAGSIPPPGSVGPGFDPTPRTPASDGSPP